MLKILGTQLRKPSGFYGNLVSKMMEFRNKAVYEAIINELNIQTDENIYEIGYGPGFGVHLIAEKYSCNISGIDFSALMYNKAFKKNNSFIMEGKVNLSYGDLLKAETANEKYNKIFCVNVIYFWIDLNQVFTKIHSMLENDGVFLIYMEHKDSLASLKFTEDFCKYSIENVESELIKTGFTRVEHKNIAKGYIVKAIK
ncbi:MAG: class I SAM-dependent methyltransferase [Bacteroidetes bacterium]|nr:class I SAM-dependent methyltransferase [Bacteroidota bacterium]